MAAPENNRRGRGRPRKFSDDQHQEEAARGYTTRRKQQDRVYGRNALGLLKKRFPDPNDERMRWLYDPEKGRVKWDLLTELGRLAEQRAEAFWAVAEWILEEQPRVKPAVKRIRALRTGKPPPGPDPDATARAIMELLDPFPEHEAYRILDRLLVTYRQEEGRD